jgi:hypothetical protein
MGLGFKKNKYVGYMHRVLNQAPLWVYEKKRSYDTFFGANLQIMPNG